MATAAKGKTRFEWTMERKVAVLTEVAAAGEAAFKTFKHGAAADGDAVELLWLFDRNVCAYVSTLRGGGAPLRVLALDLNRMGERGTLALAWAVGAGLLRSLEELRFDCNEFAGNGVASLCRSLVGAPRLCAFTAEASCGAGVWERACVPELSRHPRLRWVSRPSVPCREAFPYEFPSACPECWESDLPPSGSLP
mmetsp:Transcript_18233/g.51305  ORF Transcript_18233/g.51305 Transcript_18233/m.51305 type:complete len:195 (+) Transcript_18233:390-974(+)